MAYKVKSKRRTLKSFDYQTGKRKSLYLDKKYKAIPSGKRRSKTGKDYYETRRNRSDLKGKRI